MFALHTLSVFVSTFCIIIVDGAQWATGDRSNLHRSQKLSRSLNSLEGSPQDTSKAAYPWESIQESELSRRSGRRESSTAAKRKQVLDDAIERSKRPRPLVSEEQSLAPGINLPGADSPLVYGIDGVNQNHGGRDKDYKHKGFLQKLAKETGLEIQTTSGSYQDHVIRLKGDGQRAVVLQSQCSVVDNHLVIVWPDVEKLIQYKFLPNPPNVVL